MESKSTLLRIYEPAVLPNGPSESGYSASLVHEIGDPVKISGLVHRTIYEDEDDLGWKNKEAK